MTAGRCTYAGVDMAGDGSELTRFESETVKWTKRLAIVAAVSNVIAVLALIVVAAQWYEMHAGGVDTRTLANAASEQAKHLAEVSTAATNIFDEAKKFVADEHEMLRTSQLALESSKAANKSLIGNSMFQFELENRAWVGITGYTFSGELSAEAPFHVEVRWTNTGRTPAIQVREILKFAVSDKEPTELPPIAPFELERNPDMAPSGVGVTPITTTLPPSLIADVKLGRRWLSFVGQITYKDIFGEDVHTTTYCLLYSARFKKMEFCQGGFLMT